MVAATGTGTDTVDDNLMPSYRGEGKDTRLLVGTVGVIGIKGKRSRLRFAEPAGAYARRIILGF